FLKSLTIRSKPNLNVTLLTPEDRYIKERSSGMPWRKFDLHVDTTPIVIADADTVHNLPRDQSTTEAEIPIGGKQLTARALQFNTKNDFARARIDVWLDEELPPTEAPIAPVFSGRITVGTSPVSIRGVKSDYPLSIPPGEYTVNIRLANPGHERDEETVTQEIFNDELLERYEVIFRSVPKDSP
ncbi:hypothetical protein OAH18_01525, partial [bacterium]|nr:hypothetical protein [bacterium]